MPTLKDEWGVPKGDPGEVVWCVWGADTLEV
jgi:hypothetical protein